jgi:integrase
MRGHIVKRMSKATKDGKPRPLYYVVVQVNGKPKWETVPHPRTLKHAEKLLTERLNQLNRGEYVVPSRMTFGEFKDVWLTKYAEGQVRPSTLAMYHSLFRTHIIPAFGGMELAKIGVEDVQGFKSALLAEDLSPQSVKHALRLVRQMLGHACDWGYLAHNPARKVKDPKIPRHEMDCLTPEEARAFLDHVPERWYPFFLTAITTGMRFGELLAMRWANLDWGRGQYFVRETLTRGTEVHEVTFSVPKTEGSAQPVDLTPTCLEALRKHRARQAGEKLQAGESYQDQDLIFATATGTHLDHRNLARRVFFPALKAAGLRQIRFHDLRHTCASLLIYQGESPKYIQRQMRHASVEITFDRYGHLFPDANREAARRLDATLFGSQGQAGAGNA